MRLQRAKTDGINFFSPEDLARRPTEKRVALTADAAEEHAAMVTMVKPACPANGTYDVDQVDARPTCTLGTSEGHTL